MESFNCMEDPCINNYKTQYSFDRANKITEEYLNETLKDYASNKEDEDYNKLNSPLKGKKFLNLSRYEENKQPKENPIKENPIKENPLPVNINYKLVLPTNENNFIEDYLHEINSARLDYKKYVEKIHKLKSNLIIDSDTEETYLIYKKEQIPLKKGPLVFSDCINYFEDLKISLKNEGNYLKQIKYVNELEMSFPKNLENWDNDLYISKQMKNLKKMVKGKYVLEEFFRMKCLNIGEISAILNILEEKYEVRSTIFNKDIKFCTYSI